MDSEAPNRATEAGFKVGSVMDASGKAKEAEIADEPYEQRRFESEQRYRTEAALTGASECARCGPEPPGDLPELPVPFLSCSSP
jgi:hypothetical protein